jgi:hypothetical protein
MNPEGRLLRPVNIHDTPSGARWTYEQPSTHKRFSEPSMKLLTKAVRKHREAMVDLGRTEEDLDLRPGWYERLLHDVCTHMNGKARCEEYTTEDGKPTKRWVGLTDMTRFIGTVRKWVASGGKWESAEEARRRAEICLQCPHHQYVSCFGCRGILKEIAEVLGKPESEVDTRLQGCGLCGCQLSVKVYMPKDTVTDPSIPWPEQCWLKS